MGIDQSIRTSPPHSETAQKYIPMEIDQLSFHDKVQDFLSGRDSPVDYLERCLDAIVIREPVVKGWVTLNAEQARARAVESEKRYRDGQPLSLIDGLPIGIKDLVETEDFPTGMGFAPLADNFPKREGPSIRALRESGAVIVGKTATTELGLWQPGPTTNPFDPSRTPGGSSSGSAAVVAAKMVPAAIGTQGFGSIIRPASYCGNFALKPTYGALHIGEGNTVSHVVMGVHAGTLRDMWNVAITMARRTGGDPGKISLAGPTGFPSAMRPQRMIVLETEGWKTIDSKTRKVFDKLVQALAREGVDIVTREDNRLVAALEGTISDATEMAHDIVGFELRHMLDRLDREFPNKLSERTKDFLEASKAVGVDRYEARLEERDVSRRRLESLASVGDALITLGSPGPAPEWKGDPAGRPLIPRPTGIVAFNTPASLWGAPALNVPLLSVGGMPLGVQLIGQLHQDCQLVRLASWMKDAIPAIQE